MTICVLLVHSGELPNFILEESLGYGRRSSAGVMGEIPKVISRCSLAHCRTEWRRFCASVVKRCALEHRYARMGDSRLLSSFHWEMVAGKRTDVKYMQDVD